MTTLINVGIHVTQDDDGTLMVSIPPGAHALRERVLLLALGCAAPTAPPGTKTPTPTGHSGGPGLAGIQPVSTMEQKILEVLAEHAPCSPAALWSAFGLSGGPGPNHRDALKKLVASGRVEVSGSTTNRTVTLT